MIILNIVLTIFILLELLNVLALYFSPTLKQANAVGVFMAWEKSKHDPQIHNFVKYLVYWVAGSKLIFLSLLIAILIFADPTQKIAAVGVLVLSIATFYYKMYPLIRQMDSNGEIKPKGYSKTLGIMIAAFMFSLSIAAIIAYYNLP